MGHPPGATLASALWFVVAGAATHDRGEHSLRLGSEDSIGTSTCRNRNFTRGSDLYKVLGPTRALARDHRKVIQKPEAHVGFMPRNIALTRAIEISHKELSL